MVRRRQVNLTGQLQTNLDSYLTEKIPGFGDCGDADGHSGLVPSERYLTSILSKAIELDEADANQHTAYQHPDQHAMDDSHKIPRLKSVGSFNVNDLKECSVQRALLDVKMPVDLMYWSRRFWAKDLHPELQRYAALDAFASRMVFEQITKFHSWIGSDMMPLRALGWFYLYKRVAKRLYAAVGCSGCHPADVVSSRCAASPTFRCKFYHMTHQIWLIYASTITRHIGQLNIQRCKPVSLLEFDRRTPLEVAFLFSAESFASDAIIDWLRRSHGATGAFHRLVNSILQFAEDLGVFCPTTASARAPLALEERSKQLHHRHASELSKLFPAELAHYSNSRADDGEYYPPVDLPEYRPILPTLLSFASVGDAFRAYPCPNYPHHVYDFNLGQSPLRIDLIRVVSASAVPFEQTSFANLSKAWGECLQEYNTERDRQIALAVQHLLGQWPCEQPSILLDQALHSDPPVGTDVPTLADLRLWVAHSS
ncbi:hypothetical protein B0H13DRAFT_2361861 [Mycena leptocephala]|nr:hypothetical protein B0H13DRAFT_2361861 [Mycena leptocephala]